MFKQILNWKTGLAFLAILIASATIFYSQYLAKKIATEERQKVEYWVEAGKYLINSPTNADTKLASLILTENTSIPIIETDEKDSILNYINLDSTKAKSDIKYLNKKLANLKSQNDPIVWINPSDSTQSNLYYYGESLLLKEVRYYPMVQLFIIALFVVITLLALRSNYRSVQNQVWAGMAKETAHQLGTPVSSLTGWVEMLKLNNENEKIVSELEKDVNRLQLVSDRFGKIGSTPQLEQKEIIAQVSVMMDYMKKRAAGKVSFIFNTHEQKEIIADISPPLFDWVIENLLKNALDAMEGKGTIEVSVQQNQDSVNIDISDSGKGIARQYQNKIFKPGYTTKKRGWGLGLSLSKRIIEQYHKGEIFVKNSEPGKGTTFRIVLKK
jgi:signal transduction histidine kinase